MRRCNVCRDKAVCSDCGGCCTHCDCFEDEAVYDVWVRCVVVGTVSAPSWAKALDLAVAKYGNCWVTVRGGRSVLDVVQWAACLVAAARLIGYLLQKDGE